MNKPFKIVHYRSGCRATFYSIQFDEESECEFDKFLAQPDIQDNPELNAFLSRLDDILNRYGCQERFFKLEESSFYDSVAALWRGKIRLYCCRLGEIILILGGGGIKTTRTYQQDGSLARHVEFLAKLSKLLDLRIREKDIQIRDFSLVGNLNFSRDDFDENKI